MHSFWLWPQDRMPDISKGQTRMDTLRQTIEIVKDIAENIRMSGYTGIIVNISNPADVVTHYLQHVLDWPANQIFSTSTTLDSARLRRALADKTGIDQKSIYAYALGEHGESQMVPWSTVSIAGKPLFELMKEEPETFGSLNLKEIADAQKAIRRYQSRGLLTPTSYNIIKYPFWQMTNTFQQAFYVCLNQGEAYAPEEIRRKSVCMNEDIGSVLKEL